MMIPGVTITRFKNTMAPRIPTRLMVPLLLPVVLDVCVYPAHVYLAR
jgi:hypothetical protein